MPDDTKPDTRRPLLVWLMARKKYEKGSAELEAARKEYEAAIAKAKASQK